jgi:hypothetical protein
VPEHDGCRSLRRVLASIWRMRSRPVRLVKIEQSIPQVTRRKTCVAQARKANVDSLSTFDQIYWTQRTKIDA